MLEFNGQCLLCSFRKPAEVHEPEPELGRENLEKLLDTNPAKVEIQLAAPVLANQICSVRWV
jgi:hypothetical protein